MLTSGKSPPSATFHPLLARPGMAGFLALCVGHLLARWTDVGLAWPWLILVGLGAGLLLLRPVSHWGYAVGFLLLVTGVGAWQGGDLLVRDGEAARRVTALADGGSPLGEVAGRLSRMPTRSASHWTLTLRPGSEINTRGASARLSAPVAVRVRADPSVDRDIRPLIPGDGVVATGELLELPRSPGGAEMWGWLSDRGALLLVQARVVEALPRGAGPLSPARWARWSWEVGHGVEAFLQARLPPDEAALLIAMTLGRTGHLSAEQRQAFRRAGLMHIFAVSGLHTALVGGLFLGLLRLAGVPVRLRLCLLVLFLAFFATLVGWKASVLRAALLLLLFDARELLRRPIDPLSALGTVGMILLLFSPRALWQVDFQMTFLCMVAIFLSGPWLNELRKALGGILGWSWPAQTAIGLARIFALSAVIQLALAPVLAARFGEVSIVAPVANVVLLPMAGLLIKGAFLSLAWSLGFPASGAAMISLLEMPLAWLGGGAGLLAAPSIAAVKSAPWPMLLTAGFYLVLAGAEWNRGRHPTQPRRPPSFFLPPFLLLLLVLVWIPLASALPGPLRVHVLDVGQGDAILIRSPDGHHALIDAGPPGSAWFLPEMLRSRGVASLDWVIATHADADHIGGMDAVLREFPVGKLLVGGSLATTQLFANLRDSVGELRQPVATVRRGARLPLGGEIVFEVLHPTEEFATGDLSRNDSSIVVRTEFGGVSILLTGDAEAPAERDMVDSLGEGLQSTIFLAAHHGSRGSTTEEFLEAVEPELALISCGRNNRYGHPAPETLGRLAAAGVSVLRTDQDGTILVEVTRRGGYRWAATRR